MEIAQKLVEKIESIFFPEYDSFEKGLCKICNKEKAVYKPLRLCMDDLIVGYYSREIKMNKRRFEAIKSAYRAYLSSPFIFVFFEKKLLFQFLLFFAFLEITFFVKDKIDYFLDNCLN